MPARVLRRPTPDGRWVFELGHSAPITGVLVRGDTVLSGAGDGSFLVRSGDGHYQAPDLLTYRIYGVAWDPDGEHAVLATEGGLQRVTPTTGEATALANPPAERAVYAVASGRGVGVAGDENGDLWLWRAGGQPERWLSLEATIRSVHVVDEPVPGVLVSDSLGNLRLFDLATGRERWAVTDLAPGDVRAVAVLGRTFLLGGERSDGQAGVLRVGDLGTGSISRRVVLTAPVLGVAALDDRFVAATSDDTWHTWSIDLARFYTSPEGEVPGIATVCSADDYVVLGTVNGTVAIFDAAGERGLTLEPVRTGVVAAGIDAESAFAVTSDMESVAVWSLETCDLVVRHPWLGAITVAFADDTDILTTDGAGTLRLHQHDDMEAVVSEGEFHNTPRTLGYFAGQAVGIDANNRYDAIHISTMERSLALRPDAIARVRRFDREGAWFVSKGATARLRVLFIRGDAMVVERGNLLHVPDAALPLLRWWDGTTLHQLP